MWFTNNIQSMLLYQTTRKTVSQPTNHASQRENIHYLQPSSIHASVIPSTQPHEPTAANLESRRGQSTNSCEQHANQQTSFRAAIFLSVN